jgi:hypothetical protein
MTGSTIDHLISLLVFLAAILLFMGLFNQTIQTAILYQRHRSIATKCSDSLDNMLLNPGSPADWGKTNIVPTGFGIQDPDFKQYRLSQFSSMRLLSSAGDKVYYSRTGKWYSNVSWGVGGGYLLLQEGDCLDYSTASRLLGTNGTYGFQLTVAPILTISIREVQSGSNPLKLEVKILGPGSPLTNATVNYLMFWANATAVRQFSGGTTSDDLGLAYLNFDGTSGLPRIQVSQNQTAYTFIAKAGLGGLSGVGYKSREVVTTAGNIIPYIDNYKNGTVLLAHKWGKSDPPGSLPDLHFNATFYALSDNFSPIKVNILNVTGSVNYGAGKPFYAVYIPQQVHNETGFLTVTYWAGNAYGMVVMPWGIGTIGVSVVFGDNPSSKEWVATDMRQVILGDVSYQAKLALWSVQSYQVVS